MEECKVDFRSRMLEMVTELKYKDAFSLKNDLNSIEGEKERRIDEIRAETRLLEKDCHDLQTKNA